MTASSSGPASTPGLTASVWAEQGGAIVSLRDHRGYEWLAQPAGQRGSTVVAPPVFTDGRMSGWDECAPSISACRTAAGDDIPDHGDLWSIAWTTDRGWLVGHGASLGYVLRRRIDRTPAGLRLEYEAEATEREVPFFWSAHPQFRSPVGAPVVIDGVGQVVDVLAPDASLVDWSDDLARLDTLPEPGSRKIVLPRDVAVSSASIAAPDGRRLTMSWDPDLLPHLAVWFDRLMFSREPVIALEPATGWYDSLAMCEANGTAWSLRPGRARRWWVELTVT
ncbi:MAG TPA: hypothetical protein VIP77_16805 [Jiangellaceae bacterium]